MSTFGFFIYKGTVPSYVVIAGTVQAPLGIHAVGCFVVKLKTLTTVSGTYKRFREGTYQAHLKPLMNHQFVCFWRYPVSVVGLVAGSPFENVSNGCVIKIF